MLVHGRVTQDITVQTERLARQLIRVIIRRRAIMNNMRAQTQNRQTVRILAVHHPIRVHGRVMRDITAQMERLARQLIRVIIHWQAIMNNMRAQTQNRQTVRILVVLHPIRVHGRATVDITVQMEHHARR